LVEPPWLQIVSDQRSILQLHWLIGAVDEEVGYWPEVML